MDERFKGWLIGRAEPHDFKFEKIAKLITDNDHYNNG